METMDRESFISRNTDKDLTTTVCDQVFLVATVIIAFFSVGAHLASVISGGMLLRSIAGFSFSNCPILLGIGVSAIVYGSVLVLLIVALFTQVLYQGLHSTLRLSQKRVLVVVGRVALYAVLPFVLLLIALALTIGSVFMWSMSAQQAPLSVDYSSVRGIDGPISISRDTAGLTHIKAATHRDALFGHGFATAQDRLWQLEFQRLVAKGQLAAHVGNAGLKTDKGTRTMNFANAAGLMCSNLSESNRTLMQSYVDGINFFLQNVAQRPPEFLFMSKRLLFFHEPLPFEILDVCLAAKLLQYQLSLNAPLEIRRLKVFMKTNRSYNDVNDLFVNQTNISHTILSAQQMNLSENDAVSARQREQADSDQEKRLYDEFFTTVRSNGGKYSSLKDDRQGKNQVENDIVDENRLLTGEHRTKPLSNFFSLLDSDFDVLSMKREHASNAWAARTSGSASNQACGASDPHLKINMPSVWYYSHLSYKDASGAPFDTAGVGMAGIPGVHIGKTTYVSWGITMSLTDLEDLYVLIPDESKPAGEAYMVNHTSHSFRVRLETIEVLGQKAPVVLRVKDSIYGPVVTDVLEIPIQMDVALNTVILQEDDTSVQALLNLGSPRIRNVTQLRDQCFALLRTPGFSIPMEDSSGNMAYTMTATHHVRAPGHTGKFPTIGNGSFDHRGTIPFAELPTIVIPNYASDTSPSFIATANQKIYPDGYRYTLGYDYVYPFRGGRIQDLLTANGAALSNISFHKTVQQDTHSNMWAYLSTLLNQSSVGFTTKLQQQAGGQAAVSAWNRLLNQWDGRSSMRSTEASLFWFWYQCMAQLPADAIAAVNWNVWSNDGYVLKLIGNPSSTMLRECAAVTGSGNCIDFAAQCFAKTVSLKGFGVQWGVDVNRLSATHLMMHGSILECMFDRSTYKDGDISTIDVADSNLSANFVVVAASSMRQLYDWANPGTVQFVIPGGESGYPYSQFYMNFLNLFSLDQYVTVAVSSTSTFGVSSTQTLNN